MDTVQFEKLILNGEKARFALKQGVDIVANSVRVTLGPAGRRCVLDRGISMGLTPLVTRDGVTVANHVNAVDPSERLGAHLCREASQKTMDAAGDGTTSTCVLVQSMVDHGIRLLAAGTPSASLEKGMALALDEVINQINLMSLLITDDSLYNIALVSSNNDPTVAQLVYDGARQVGKDGIMLIEESHSPESYLTLVSGLQTHSGYDDTSPYFITSMDKSQCIFHDPFLFLYEGTISTPKSLVPLLKLAHENSRPLLIIAGDYENTALATLVGNKTQNNMELCAIRSNAFGSRRKEVLKDIALLTGATAFTEDIGRKLESVTLNDLGSCKKVIVDRKTTIISDGDGNPEDVRSRISSLRLQIQETKDPSTRQSLEARLAGLAGGVAVFSVGAATETAMKEKKDRMDDAMRATRCAMQSGIVPGGGVALLTAAIKARSYLGDQVESGCQVILEACCAPMRQIATNAGVSPDMVISKVSPVAAFGYGYNARTNKFTNLMEDGVIDPCSVVVESLRNAASIATLILTSECLIAEVSIDKGE